MTGGYWPVLALVPAAAAALAGGGAASRLGSLRLGPGAAVDRDTGRPGDDRADRSLAGRPGRGRAWQRARRRPDSAELVASVPSSLALELRSGRDLAAALSAVADEHLAVPELAGRLSAASAAAAAGLDPGPSLAASPLRPVHSRERASAVETALRPTASCLSAGHRAGLPVADLLDSVASATAAAAEISALARAELAGSRASAFLLAGLPVAGLGLGQLLGAAPLGFLLGQSWGRLCLVLALLLTGAGALWTRALTRSLLRELAP